MTREDFLRQEIEKYEKKIATYQAMVAEWRSELGVSTLQNQTTQLNPSAARKEGQDLADPLSLIQGMIFFNKSQSEAAKAFLEMVGYPLKTGTILEAVEKGGITVGGKTPTAKKQNFYTILHRSLDFGLVKKDTWGLATWPGVVKKAAEEEIEQEESGAEGSKKASGESKPS